MPALGEVMPALESVSSTKFETVPGKMTMIFSSLVTILRVRQKRKRE